MRVPRNDRLASLRQLGVCSSGRKAGGGGRVRRCLGRVSGAAMSCCRHAGLVPASRHPRVRRSVSIRTAGCRHKVGMTCGALKRRQAQDGREIFPEWIVPFDQVELVVAWPLLDPLLGRDCGFHRVGRVVPDELEYAVTVGEAGKGAVAMLYQATNQIRRHADVQCAVATARQDVDAWLPLSHIAETAESWMPGQARHDGGVCG